MKRAIILAALAAVVSYAQYYVAAGSTSTLVGSSTPGPTTTTAGYRPGHIQSAILGSSIADDKPNLMLLGNTFEQGLVVVEMYTGVHLNIDDITTTESYVPATGQAAINLDHVGGVAVLRPLNGEKQSALVALLSTRSLFVYEIKRSSGQLSAIRLAVNDLPDNLTLNTTYSDQSGYQKRLALLSTSNSGATTFYHLAASNPGFPLGGNNDVGRVDFISIDNSTWGLSQPNQTGITSLTPSNMYSLGPIAKFGSGLAPAGDVDGDGVPDLAVLAPPSTSYPNSALFVILMENANTPKNQLPIVWSGGSEPWRADPATISNAASDYTQSCTSLSSQDLDFDNRPELIVGCSILTSAALPTYWHYFRAFKTAADGLINQVQRFSGITYAMDSEASSAAPLVMWDKNRVMPTIYHSSSAGAGKEEYFLTQYWAFNNELVRNYAIEAGVDSKAVVDIDSLFNRSGYTSYTFQTLAGLVDCELNGKNMSCKADTGAAGSWSVIEATSMGDCSPYSFCKAKDTLYVYAYPKGLTPSPVLRLPSQVMPVNAPALALGNIHQWSYFPGYPRIVTNASIIPGGSEALLQKSQAGFDEWTLTPVANKAGIDTVLFGLTENVVLTPQLHERAFHVVAPEQIIAGAVPATPGDDTLYNVAAGQYIELPTASKGGVAYTYDIQQSLKGYAELVGNYLHILRPDQDVRLEVRYVVKKQIRARTLVLNSLPRPSSITSKFTTPLHLREVAQGVLIEGLHGSYQVQVLNTNGQLLLRSQGQADHSVLVPLKGDGLRIIQVRSGSQTQVLKLIR